MDDILICEYLSGKDDAINILIERYKKPLYKLCFYLARNNSDADDLFQETWIKVIRHINRYRSKNFKGFLYKICINTYRDQYRRTRKNKDMISFLEDELFAERIENADTSNCESIVISKEQYNCMMEKLNALKDHYRIPIILFYIEGMQYSRIAEVMNIPLGTVKSRISKGREKLKEFMEVSYDAI